MEPRILGLSAEAFASGIIAGLIAFGGQLVTNAWLRTDIDRAHRRITEHEEIFHYPKRKRA